MSNTISLNVDTNPDYVPTDEEELIIDHGDLTQLGLRRNRLPIGLHVPIIKDAVFTFPNCGAERAIVSLCQPENALTEAALIRMTIDTSLIRASRIGNSNASHEAAILDLQKALDPLTAASIKDVINSSIVQNFVVKLQNQAETNSNVLGGFLGTIIGADDRVRTYLTMNDIIANPEVTNVDELAVNNTKVREADYGVLVGLANVLSALPENVQNALDRLTCLALIASAPLEEYAYEHPVIKGYFEEARRELMTRRLKLPDSIVAHYDTYDYSRLVQVALAYSLDNGQTFFPLTVKGSKKAVMAELAFFVLSYNQVRTTNPDRSAEFAFTRMLSLRYGLFADSDELATFHLRGPIAVPKDVLRLFTDNYRRNEKYYILMYASAISFLKSGHHASAANLDNTIMKMMQAVNIPCTLDAARQMIATGVYAGTHAASMRLLIGYLLHRNVTQKVTNAVAYRLAPNPPNAAGYCNLELFIEALNAAGFFYALDRVQEYNEFKRNMREIRATMWYVAPYSMYLYNRNVQDPLDIKASVAKLASYAAGISHALPSSSLNISPSLKKLADAQKVNSIAGPLFVQAYSAAFTRWARMTIESALKKKYGVRASLLE
jgi:hypothetical protein